MQSTVERKSLQEVTANSVGSVGNQSSKNDLERLVVEIRAEGGFSVVDAVNAMGKVSETASKAASEFSAGGASQAGSTTARAQSRKAQIQLQIARVEAMNVETLRSGITQEINHEINRLYSQARSMNRWFMRKFSAYELNQIMSKIRKLREELIDLIKLSLEKLRELYITMVLKLQVVKA